MAGVCSSNTLRRSIVLPLLVLAFCSSPVQSIPPNRLIADEFTVRCTLAPTKAQPGHRHLDIVLHHSWAPVGVARFEQLIAARFFDGAPLYHVIPGMMVQFGASKENSSWPVLPHDKKGTQPFKKGALSLMAGEDAANANSPSAKLRSTEMFICMGEDTTFGRGNKRWERPIGMVTDLTMHVLDTLNTDYPPWEVDLVQMLNTPDYLAEFPLLDHFERCTVVPAVWAQFEHKMEEEQGDGSWYWLKLMAIVTPAVIWARLSWLKKSRDYKSMN